MTDRQQRIDRALEIAAEGSPYEACEVLWPLVRDEGQRDDALFAMAFCLERAGNLPTAAYLYGRIAERHPEFNVAVRRLEACREELDARGIHEDFGDSGHVDCPCGAFRYRAELGLCPYCGRRPGEAPEAGAVPEDLAIAPAAGAGETGGESEAGEQAAEEQQASPLEDAWKAIQDKFEAFTQRADLGETGQRVQVLAKELSARARQFAESDAVKETTRKTRELGEEAVSKIRETAEREDVQRARGRLEQWSREAANRVETWAKREDVQKTGRRVMDTLEGFVAKLQGYIDRVKGAPEKDEDE